MRAPYSPVRLIYGKNSKIGHSLTPYSPVRRYSPENTVHSFMASGHTRLVLLLLSFFFVSVEFQGDYDTFTKIRQVCSTSVLGIFPNFKQWCLPMPYHINIFLDFFTLFFTLGFSKIVFFNINYK